MFGLVMKELLGVDIPSQVFAIALTLILVVVNLRGIDMFAKVQNVIAFSLIGSFLLLGVCGALGISTGTQVVQPATTASPLEGVAMAATAFWLFIGVEFVIPISSEVKNPRKNVPLGMFLSLAVIAVIQIFMVFGLKNYVLWGDLAAADSPHMLYGVNLFGRIGQIWIGMISILAAVSTQNSVLNGLSHICQGMAKTNMMPSFFGKTNKYGTPVAGVLLMGIVFLIIEGSGLASSDAISFLLLTASVFWMVSYVITHINVMVLRVRLPKAPRTFKLPFGPLLPIIGIAGDIYMIIHISNDPAQRLRIWLIVGVIFAVLAIYSFFWIRYKMKKPLFKPVPPHEVLAMEHPLYNITHRRVIVKKTERKGQLSA